MKSLYIDLETTGTLHWRHGIHQISGCIEIDNVVVEEFDYNVRPNPLAQVDQEALKASNVSAEQINGYEPMNVAFLKFENMLAKYVDKFNKKDKFFLIGYNVAGFDNQFLRAWFKQNATNKKAEEYGNYFGSWFWSNTIDVMVLAAEKLKYVRHEMVDFKLMTVAKQLGFEIDESKLHDASYDIALTRKIYKLITN